MLIALVDTIVGEVPMAQGLCMAVDPCMGEATAAPILGGRHMEAECMAAWEGMAG